MMGSKLSAWLKLARLSNIPTVFSNVLVGVAVAAHASPLSEYYKAPLHGWEVLLAIVTASFFYTGGMALNDLLDRGVDARERPQRPIPSGALSVLEVGVFTAICFLIPLSLIVLLVPQATVAALALIASIFLYNTLHKLTALSMLLMGACRALVYVLAASIYPSYVSSENLKFGLLVFGGILAAYIVGLSVVARQEVGGKLGYRRWLAVAMAVASLGLLIPASGSESWNWTPLIVLLLCAWLIRSAWLILRKPPKVVPAILGWLAGISLLDAVFLAILDRPELVVVAFGCFAVTVWGHQRIPGT